MAPSLAVDQQPLCPGYYAFECTEVSCCARYHQSVLYLFFTLGVFAIAVLVGVVWCALDFRPNRM